MSFNNNFHVKSKTKYFNSITFVVDFLYFKSYNWVVLPLISTVYCIKVGIFCGASVERRAAGGGSERVQQWRRAMAHRRSAAPIMGNGRDVAARTSSSMRMRSIERVEET
jgi:hypothetical protein